MVELLLTLGEGRCLRRVQRRPIANRPGFNRWPGQPMHLSVKNPNAAEAEEQRSPPEILAEIAALDAENTRVLTRTGGLLG
jgi:hypothetical protein